MRSLPRAAALCLLAACSSGQVEHDASMVFGDVELGQSRLVALVLTNHSSAPEALTFESPSEDFTVEEASRTLSANETSIVHVRFTPSDLGPRTGTLSIHGALGESEVTLSGRGTGPRFSTPTPLSLGLIALVTGQPAMPFTAKVVVRNVGTAGSALRLGAPRVDAAELCVGVFVGSTCHPWEPPTSLDTQALLEVPLAVLAATPGPRRWSVVFPSNDVLHPEVAVEVTALVESFEPCVFSAPAEVLVTSTSVLRLTHLGPGTCLVKEVTLTSAPAGFLESVNEPRLPLRLETGASLVVSIALRPSAPLQLTGNVHVVAAGTPALDVFVRREASPAPCLTISPPVVDFGAVRQDCNSPNRSVQLYNSCASPLTVYAVELISAAGAPPGSVNCPGSAPCPEFFVAQGISPGTVLLPGSSTPAVLSFKYRPLDFGLDTGAVRITTLEAGDWLISLQGLGDASAHQVDTFRQDSNPMIDVLVMVDPSPSFVPKRANVRANLAPMLRYVSNACFDARWAFAAADGAPGAAVRLLPNDAGASWTPSTDPSFVELALSAFDALPVGSELEACIGPASDLVQDAGLRAGSSFSGFCITDALEQSPNPTAALQALQSLRSPSQFSWSAITALASSSCGVEAADDGVHRSLVTAANGTQEDICLPSWWQSLVGLTSPVCGFRNTFYLTSRPASPLQLELRIDGRPVPATDWTLDSVNNAVIFASGRAPAAGETLVINYSVACVP